MARVIRFDEFKEDILDKHYHRMCGCYCCSNCIFFEEGDEFEWCSLLEFSAENMKEDGACAWAQLEGDDSPRVIIKPVYEEDEEESYEGN